jgi:hypothetical protein
MNFKRSEKPELNFYCYLHPSPMKYLDFLLALDVICRYYPLYYANEDLLLADDILKWFNNELPEDSSALVYLKSSFNSPSEALQAVWKEIQLTFGSYLYVN